MNPQPKDPYAKIYKEQKYYEEKLKRAEIIENYKRKKLREEQEHKYVLKSLQSNLDNDSAPRPKIFIADLFPRGSLSAVVAAPGTGKTWFLQLLASNLSVGGQIFGGFAEEVKPLKSLIFAGEAGPDLLFQRAHETRWNLNRENIVVVGLLDAERKNTTLMLDKEEGRKNIEYFVQSNKPDIVFFDTFASFHTKNENKFDDMKPLITFLLSIAEKYNVAVVLMHHTRKSATKKKTLVLDDAIGSSIFIRLIGVILSIEAYGENQSNQSNQSGAKTMIVRTLKTWFQEFEPFTFTISSEDWQTSIDIDLLPAFDEAVKAVVEAGVLKYTGDMFGLNKWFKANDLPAEIDGIGLPSGYAQRLLTILANQRKLKRRGFGRNTFYQCKA